MLDYWTWQGMIKPSSLSRIRGFSRSEAALVSIAATLRDRCVPLSAVKKILRELRQQPSKSRYVVVQPGPRLRFLKTAAQVIALYKRTAVPALLVDRDEHVKRFAEVV